MESSQRTITTVLGLTIQQWLLAVAIYKELCPAVLRDLPPADVANASAILRRLRVAGYEVSDGAVPDHSLVATSTAEWVAALFLSAARDIQLSVLTRESRGVTP